MSKSVSVRKSAACAPNQAGLQTAVAQDPILLFITKRVFIQSWIVASVKI